MCFVMVTCYPQYNMTPPIPSPAHTGAAVAPSAGVPGLPGMCAISAHKDYSRPLHVDCSVEYELPDAAKPPAGTRSEPLLMIHPCFYRRAEAQRRTRFVNNLPKSSLSSPSYSVVSASRRPKIARLTPAELPVSSSSTASRTVSRYKTRETVSLQIPVAATPSVVKIDPSAVLSDLLVKPCSEINNNNNYLIKPSEPVPSQPQQQQNAQQRLYERQLTASLASATAVTAAAAVASTYQVGGDGTASANSVSTASAEYQQMPGYHPLAAATPCKACQPSYHHSHHSQQHPGAMHPSIGNRMFGGGIIKAVEPGPEQAAASALHQKVRRLGVKRCRSSRAQDVSGALNSPQQPQQTSLVLHQQQQQQHHHQQQQQPGSLGTLWVNNGMLHLGPGISFESPATATGSATQTAGGGVWGSYGQAAAPNVPAPPAGGAGAGTTAIVAAEVWGSMFPHCREKEEENRVLWSSDSLLRLVPV